MIDLKPTILKGLRQLRATMSALVRDRSGVAAIEFAFVVPILLCMYLMTMEISQAIEANKKLGRAGNLVGDLVTQQGEITSSEIQSIMEIGEALIQPYNRSVPSITVTAINIGSDAETKETTAKVLWSRRMGLDENNKKAFTAAENPDGTVPSFLNVPGTFVIRVDAELDYMPVLLGDAQGNALGIGSAFDVLVMGETYYMRPRRSTTIECKDC